VALPRPVFMQLQRTECENLKDFLRAHSFRGFESDDAGLDLDMDTPEDYQEILRRQV
jgi:CTP:molybdopterin cytidylyltransferase MocA